MLALVISNQGHSMMSYDWLKVALKISRSMVWEKKKLASRAFIHDRHVFQAKRSVLSIKDKNEDADDILFQMIRKSVVLLLILLFINIHIFDYPDPRLSGLLRVVLTSPDNGGSTVLLIVTTNTVTVSVCSSY